MNKFKNNTDTMSAAAVWKHCNHAMLLDQQQRQNSISRGKQHGSSVVGQAWKIANIQDHRLIVVNQRTIGCLHTVSNENAGWDGARIDLRIPACYDYWHGLFPDQLFNLEQVEQLFGAGLNFVYGMLFRHVFAFQPSFMESVRVSSTSNNKTPMRTLQHLTPSADDDDDARPVFSVALHSRHPDNDDDGSDVSEDWHCLKKILRKHGHRATSTVNVTSSRHNTPKFQVFIATDRPKTTAALTKRLAAAATSSNSSMNCEVLTVNHTASAEAAGGGTDTYTIKKKLEHGPHPGIGFWRDFGITATGG